MWMCNASRTSLRPDGFEWCKDVMDGTYMPYPCKIECFDPLEWPHILFTLEVYVNPKPTNFCALEGYDIQTFHMITSTYREIEDHSLESQFDLQDQVSIEDIPLTTYNSIEIGDHKNSSRSCDDDDEGK